LASFCLRINLSIKYSTPQEELFKEIEQRIDMNKRENISHTVRVCMIHVNRYYDTLTFNADTPEEKGSVLVSNYEMKQRACDIFARYMYELRDKLYYIGS
jgi:hypothetical protein